MVKQPFQDQMGRWWCYRSDGEALDAGALPLGPFYTKEYASESAHEATRRGAPIKLLGRKPFQMGLNEEYRKRG